MKELTPTPESTTIGRLVKKLRMSNGLLLGEAAEAMNVTAAWLSRLEHGRQELTPDALQTIITWAELLPTFDGRLGFRDRI